MVEKSAPSIWSNIYDFITIMSSLPNKIRQGREKHKWKFYAPMDITCWCMSCEVNLLYIHRNRFITWFIIADFQIKTVSKRLSQKLKCTDHMEKWPYRSTPMQQTTFWFFFFFSGKIKLDNCQTVETLFLLKNVTYKIRISACYMMMIWCFMSLSTLFKSYRDDKRVMIKSSVEWGGSNEYSQSMFWAEIWKISLFYLKIFLFFGCDIFNIFE